MFGEAWPPMSVPDLAPDDDDDHLVSFPDPIFPCLVYQQNIHSDVFFFVVVVA